MKDEFMVMFHDLTPAHVHEFIFHDLTPEPSLLMFMNSSFMT